MVSRLVPENNVDLFLDATAHLDESVEVVVVGSAVGASPIEERLAELRNRGRIRWLGHVDDQELLNQLWANAAAYFHGHSAGGTNPALLQAMGFGAAAVAFDTAYNREVLGPDGLFASSSHDLTQHLRRLADDPTFREARASRGREIVGERYVWSHVCRDYATVLQDLARAASKQPCT
jgi:glycosyltransferase involved in cell wall biosynthesis